MTAAHIQGRMRRHNATEATKTTHRDHGTPGWIAWCAQFSYPPRTERAEAEADYAQAISNGCPSKHYLREIRIGSDGVHYRFVNREETAS